MARIVLLGASNVRRSLPAIVGLLRRRFGAGTEIWGAFGHGRSYGKKSCIPFRCLPGILECRIWDALAQAGGGVDLAVAADAGNDILYGEETPTILRWVAEGLARAGAETRVIVGLPLARIHHLSPAAFRTFRMLFFPSSRLAHAKVLRRAEELDAGLDELARRTGARFVEPDPAWYGTDPIHVRRAAFGAAWGRILGFPVAPPPMSRPDSIRLLLAAPEKRWICGIERRSAQPALVRRDGTRIFLY